MAIANSFPLRLLTKSSVSRRYPGLPYRGALRRLTPLRPLATLSLITGFVNGLFLFHSFHRGD
ncbi:hypothetical protein EH206_06205 [Brenneria nigrifluens DSM 30175 = ATCC 13028]|uniref:Uncharacterized protein n=1 Tax=Brenneria nigrifluens DSM 30175 = ATCC 13028 TaxID=1121120 RepID=A0ABX5V134_9GAMM|nr:hypothetical protein EH206_06205 [Brenneria nigrifluens DSM 30175 = ATCC 13028]